MVESGSLNLPEGLTACAEALDNKKGEHLKLLYVGDISSVTDYYLIVTGTSAPHLRALGKAVSEALDEEGIDSNTSGLGDQSGWAVVDAFDFIIHIFTGETRSYYNLEGLWKDAEPVELSAMSA